MERRPHTINQITKDAFEEVEMDHLFEELMKITADPYARFDCRRATSSGRARLSDQEIQLIEAPTLSETAEIAGEGWQSAETCWDPGADDPMPD